jgi:hypothetical protein
MARRSTNVHRRVEITGGEMLGYGHFDELNVLGVTPYIY